MISALTLAAVLALGFFVRATTDRMKVPSALTLMLTGFLVGPYLPADYEIAGPWIAQAAFSLLLLRAGLGTSVREALAAFRATGVLLLPFVAETALIAGAARSFLFPRWDVSLVMAFLVAAVSPAVVLPETLRLRSEATSDAGAPEIRQRLANAVLAVTVLNVLVAPVGMSVVLDVITAGGGVGARLGNEGLRLAGGLAFGVVIGVVVRASSRRSWLPIAAVVLAPAVYFAARTASLEPILATLAAGLALRPRPEASGSAHRGDDALAAAWRWAEIPLFVNLGAAVDPSSLQGADEIGLLAALILGAVAVRATAAAVAALTLRWSRAEGAYVACANVPKATVQAVHGATPLLAFQAGAPDLLNEGRLLLVVAVLSIVLTAPLGALLLPRARRWLR